MMRREVTEFLKLRTLPSEEEMDIEHIKLSGDLLHAISRPVSDEEAIVLVGAFGPDECFGLAWTLLHLIETAPSWPIEECLRDKENEWIRRLRHRAQNAGLIPD